jgi:IS605 OrfB family transposase
MKLTMQVKLQPAAEQAARLLATMARFNAACDAIAAVAFRERCANRVQLQKLVYHDIRRDFGLSAQMTVRAIAKVTEIYKRDRDIQPAFRPHGAIVYDPRILSWKGPDRVSLLTMEGREVMPYVVGAYHARLAHRIRGQADLVYRDGMFFLYVAVEIEEPQPFEPDGFLGVDLGLKNLASDSDGNVYTGAHLASLRSRHARLRAKLQAKGTRSAKRLLKRRRRKEGRFSRDLNHRISKAIVRKAHDTGRGVALEDLTGIRGRVTVRRPQRRAHHSWPFFQLRAMIAYKARLQGVPVVFVDPRDTSRTCPECGTVDKRNRPSRDAFLCQHCGQAAPADFAAAVNIARKGGAAGRAAVMPPDAGLSHAGRAPASSVL